MKSIRRLMKLAAIPLAGALVLSACSGTPEEPAGDETTPAPDTTAEVTQITISGLAQSATPWTFHVAEAKGYFDDANIEVEFVQAQNAPSVAQSVSTATAEAGMTQADNVMSAIDEGAPLQIVGAFMGRTWLRLFSAPEVSSYEDVRGGTVSAGSTTGGTGNLLTYMLKQNGLESGDYGFLAVTNSGDRIVGMTNGQIQAGFLTPPFDSQMEREGGQLLGWYDEPFSTYTLTVNTEWAAENPEVVGNLVGAFQSAQDWIFDPANKDELITIIGDKLGQSEEDLLAAYDFLVGQEVLSPDFTIPEKGLENIAMISAEVEGTEFGEFDLDKYYTEEYLQ